MNLYDLKSYTTQHLKIWLTYRGDSLKNVETLKEAPVKLFQYFRLGTKKNLIDWTPNKIWLSNKAKLMGLTVKKENLKNLPNAPKDFVIDLSNWSLIDGWSKSLGRLPSFFIEHIDSYSQKNKYCCFIKVNKSDETFPSRRAAVREEFYWYYIYLFKTVRYIILLARGMRCKFKKNRTVGLSWHCLKLMAHFHMLIVNVLLGK